MNLNPFPQYPVVGMVIEIAIVLIISFILLQIFSYLVIKLSKKFDIEKTLSYLFRDFINYIIYIIAFIIILKILGIDITALILSFGIIGITIGFAGKDIISNFLSGIFILSDKTVKVGEVIEVNGVKGKVKKLGFRTTTLVTPDNAIVTIPNSVLSANPYVNYTYLEEQRIDLEISVPYNMNLDQFKIEFRKAISKLDWVLNSNTPKVFVKEMNGDNIKLKIIAWANDYSKVEDYRLLLADEVRKLIDENNKNFK
ncbi:small-conductance mechanosensitive channel [Methanobrevibacter cuticularis]|uniref:Small-conductance mechanosensitive channel n=1 Tax=Methanobrevibacter cuticularis TaxID=47311 RepID=A0A166CUV5_9EURY|nr:mechanosensitive ion channel family protein [Methanobrevibacter cuticularis]KZX14889.1 small-conductance mechanosensitive channel [Methanobrevibacter cuticularis]